jgi:hypothetical protein
MPPKKKTFVLDQKHQIANVLKLRQKLIQRLTPLYQNELIVQETFLSLVRDLAQLLPDSIVTDVITDSIRYVVGQRLSAKELDELCWRLAGNLPRLKQRRAVPPWNRQPFQELVPAQIVKVQLRRGGLQRGELGHEITFRILAGTSCPLKVHKWWSVRASRFMAYFRDANRHGFGFARSRGEEVSPYRYEDPRQFMSLRCLLLIDPELCDLKDGPGFQEIYHTSATMEWNRVTSVRTTCRRRWPATSARSAATVAGRRRTRRPMSWMTVRSAVWRTGSTRRSPARTRSASPAWNATFFLPRRLER